MTKKAKKAKKRPERVPLSKQKSFTAVQREGYTRRYVNDLPGRIEAFKRAGWTIVEDVDGNIKTHDGLAQVEGQYGTQVRRVVNRGSDAPCRHSVLMEIPTEWYEEDKKEQQKLIDEKEATFDHAGVHAQQNMYGGMQRKNATKV